MSKPNNRPSIIKKTGTTESEEYLTQLCKQSFLSLWSYANLYKDEGRGRKKEICDLLVVFENHIIIFSDKNCLYPHTGNLHTDWSRWYTKTIAAAAKQIWGAEKWIGANPKSIYLDNLCTQPFPFLLPDASVTKYHRIVVAHGAIKRSQEELGGSGSFMLVPSILGDKHIKTAEHDCIPFTIGQIDVSKGFVHVLDDVSLDIIMNSLDTITDFVDYFTKKEDFVLSGNLVSSAGEELLAYYLSNLDNNGEHSFVLPDGFTHLTLNEGIWETLQNSPKFQRQLEENDISYSWDMLIEKFNDHILMGTQYYSSHNEIKESEKIMRFLAKESRFTRRLLARSLMEIIHNTDATKSNARVIKPIKQGSPYYIFLLMSQMPNITEEDYRKQRRDVLCAYCLVIKYLNPDADDIIGIATESGYSQDALRSEDAFYYDARKWSKENELEAQTLQKELKILTHFTQHKTHEYEYPEVEALIQKPLVNGTMKGRDRNSSCPCGSRKKYKKCCGKT